MTPEDIWLERVVAWRKSGLSAAEFCKGKSYEVAALRGWSSRLGRAGKVERSALGRRRQQGVVSPSASVLTFARVVSRSESTERQPLARAAGGDSTLTLAVGATRIEVARGFDPALLRSVVQALGAGAA
jgi:hypothetical protein